MSAREPLSDAEKLANGEPDWTRFTFRGIEAERDAALAENQRLREELRSEMMERSDAEREIERLREELRLTTAELHAAGDHLVRLDDEVTRLRAELREDGIEHLTADAASWRRHAENCEADLDRLRAAIEKLRDDTREGEVPVLGGLATQIWFARRLTEIITPNASLGGEACISRSEMQGEEGEVVTLDEFAHTEVVSESAAPPDVGEFIDALRADGYRVVKLENATQFVGNYHFVTEDLT